VGKGRQLDVDSAESESESDSDPADPTAGPESADPTPGPDPAPAARSIRSATRADIVRAPETQPAVSEARGLHRPGRVDLVFEAPAATGRVRASDGAAVSVSVHGRARGVVGAQDGPGRRTFG
jgi:hypothetical protein